MVANPALRKVVSIIRNTTGMEHRMIYDTTLSYPEGPHAYAKWFLENKAKYKDAYQFPEDNGSTNIMPNDMDDGNTNAMHDGFITGYRDIHGDSASNKGDEVASNANGGDVLDPMENVAELQRNLKAIKVLWNEYMLGIGNHKPAKDFTSKERNRKNGLY